MKLVMSFILSCLFVSVALASPYYTTQTPVHVQGYTKSNGTYVQPYYRAEPGQARNNDSSSNNYNSYNSRNSRSRNSYNY